MSGRLLGVVAGQRLDEHWFDVAVRGCRPIREWRIEGGECIVSRRAWIQVDEILQVSDAVGHRSGAETLAAEWAQMHENV